MPAQQGFRSDGSTAAQIDDRLVEELHAMLVHGAPQPRLHVDPFERGGVHVVGVETKLVGTELLGPVHGDVRVTEQGVVLIPVSGENADADTRGDVHRAPGHPDRSFQGFEDGVRLTGKLPGIFDVGSQNRELVAAEAGDGIPRSDRAAKPCGDFAKDDVPCSPAQAVVDALELVEVDEQQGNDALVVKRGSHGLLDAIL